MAKISYNPSVIYKLFYEPPYWSKKCKEVETFKPEFYRNLWNNENSEEVFHTTPKILKLVNINLRRMQKRKEFLNIFFEYDDFLQALNAHDFIIYFCAKNRITIPYFFHIFVDISLWLMSIFLNKYNLRDFTIGIREVDKFEKFDGKQINELNYYEDIIKKLKTFDLNDEESLKKAHQEAVEIAIKNFMRVNDQYSLFMQTPYYYPYQLLEKIYENTFKKAITNIQTIDPIYRYRKKIDILSIADEIKRHKNITELTKKRFKYGLQHPDDHFIGALMQDKIEIDIDPNKGEVLDPQPYFKKFSKSLTIGYYAKGLFIANEKVRQDMIKDLNELITILQRFNNDEAKKQIEIARSIIDFLKQDKRFKEYIPFKALAKYGGFKTSQLRWFIKHLINHSAFQIYSKSKEKIKLPPLSINSS